MGTVWFFLLAASSSCIISDSLMVSPFSFTPTTGYRFRGTCELTALQSCSGAEPDFAVRVDFLTDTLETGAVGVFRSGLNWISTEEGNFETTSQEMPEVIITDDGEQRRYGDSDIVVTMNTTAKTNIIRTEDNILTTITHNYEGKGHTPS